MVVSVIIPTTISTAKAEVGTVQFNGTAQGWLESAYAEWSIDKEADGYTAYIKRLHSQIQHMQESTMNL